jgi:hypothetical protein
VRKASERHDRVAPAPAARRPCRCDDPASRTHAGVWFIATLIKMLAVFTSTWSASRCSRWPSARSRRGCRIVTVQPRRLARLLQPAADGLKNIMKEETYPARRTCRCSFSLRCCRSSRRCSRGR